MVTSYNLIGTAIIYETMLFSVAAYGYFTIDGYKPLITMFSYNPTIRKGIKLYIGTRLPMVIDIVISFNGFLFLT